MTSIERIKVGAEWNNRHGNYNLAFATCMAAECHDIDFDRFYALLCTYGSPGYPEDCLKRAWQKGRP